MSHPYYNSNSHDYSYKELLTSDEIILVALLLPKGIFIVIRFELYILLYMSHVLTSNALVRTKRKLHVRETLRPREKPSAFYLIREVGLFGLGCASFDLK